MFFVLPAASSTKIKSCHDICTVEPPLKGHLRDQDKCPLYRGVPSIEVTFIKIVETFFSFGTKVCVP